MPKERADVGPAVDPDTRKIRYLSVSSITTFDEGDTYKNREGCERKWWYRYLEHRRQPETRSTTLGNEVHAQIEHYLKTGENVLSVIPMAGKHFIPAPLTVEPGLLVEHSFGPTEADTLTRLDGEPLLMAAGIPLVGYIDVVNLRDYWLDNEGERHPMPPDSIEGIDWKSTKSLEWAKEGVVLANTTQMIGYAEWMRRWRPYLKTFRLSHGNFSTSKRAALKKTAVISVDMVQERWHKVETVAERMKEVALENIATNVKPNYKACGSFGGCPYRGAPCPQNALLTLTALIGGKNVGSLLQKAKAINAGIKPVDPKIAEEKAKLQEEEKMLREPIHCSKCNAVLTIENVSRLKDDSIVHIACPGRPAAVLPPDAPASDPKLAANPIEPETLLSLPPEFKAASAGAEGDAIKNGHNEPKVEPPPPEPQAKKRGRPAGSKNKPKDEPATKAAEPETKPEPEVEIDPAVEGAKLPEQPVDRVPLMERRILFVDVHVEGLAGAASLEPYIANMTKALADQFNVADIRCAPGDTALGFGKWKGALGALIRTQPPEPGTYTITDVRESEIKQVVVESLRPLCQLFVRGR